MLCMYAFPQCSRDNTGLPLCYEECIAVKQQFCHNDWAHIEENKNRGIYFKYRGHFELPDCDLLPKYKVENKVPSCSYIGLIDMKSDEITCEYIIIYKYINILLCINIIYKMVQDIKLVLK